MEEITSKYFIDRKEWRKWLENNFETENDIWLEYPLKKTEKNESRIMTQLKKPYALAGLTAQLNH